MSNHPSISRLLLPPKYGGCSYSESLELLNLVSSWLREAKRWLSIKLTSQLFLWLHSLFIVGSVENHPLPNAPWKNRKNVLALIEILLANFCSSRRKSSNALSIIASMSKWFAITDDVYRISHQHHRHLSVNRSRVIIDQREGTLESSIPERSTFWERLQAFPRSRPIPPRFFLLVSCA